MNTKFLIAAATATLLALGGCSTNPTNAQIGTGVGAVVGGVAGSAGAFPFLVSSAMVPFPTGPAGAGHGVPFPVTEVTVTGLQIV